MDPKNKIELRYLALLKKNAKAQEKAHQEMLDFREAIKDICPHSLTSTRTNTYDNGYGKWWSVETMYCKICGKDNVGPSVYKDICKGGGY